MNRSLRSELAIVAIVVAFAGSGAGCAAVVGADFDVSRRPDVSPVTEPTGTPGGIEGPRIVSPWNVPAPRPAKLVGLSVAVEGDWAFVGARNATWEGQVFAMTRAEPFSWDIEQTLTAEQYAFPNALFGSSVALSGDWAIVGASAEQKPNKGRVYFFHRTGNRWTLTQEVLPSRSFNGDRFGTRVAIENDMAVVGAPGAGPDEAIAGAVYFFGLGADGTWSETGSLVPPDGMTGDFFGYELALRSSTLVVGAPFNDEAGSEAGAAYVFDRPGSEWNPVPKKLLPRASDGTGYRMGLGSIGLGDGLLLVPALDKIQAYALDPSGSWMDDTLAPPRGLVPRESSWRAVIHGGRALLAVGTTDNVGMGLLYERTNADWRFVERLESGAPSPQDDVFGWTIAYDGATACFGAIFADEQDGKVYFFDLSQ